MIDAFNYDDVSIVTAVKKYMRDDHDDPDST